MRSTTLSRLSFVLLSLAQACTAPPEPAPDASPDASPQDAQTADVQRDDVAPTDVATSDSAGLDATSDSAGLDATSDVADRDASDEPDAATIRDAVPADVAPDAALELDCLDNIDNDRNGLTDCEDPACTAQVRCEPSDWTAPGALHQGAVGTSAPCGAGQTQALLATLGTAGAPASCTCSCTNPVGTGTCTVATHANEYNSSSCPAGVPPGGTNLPSVGCFESTFTSTSYLFRAGLLETGRCTPVTTPTVPAATGATLEARVCVTPPREGGGCRAGSVCRARTTPSAGTCIVHTGDVTCPTAYAQRSVFYRNTSDTRSCTGCSCGYASDGCVSDVVAYSGAGCTGSILATTTTGDGSCRAGNPASYRTTNPRSSNQRCTASTASPSGCVRDTDPSTICCAPAPGDRTCPTGPGPAMVRLNGSTGPFCIDSTEVTNAQYEAFLAAMPSVAGQPATCAFNTTFTPTSWPVTDPNRPVVGVDWCDAAAYCRWAGKTLCGRADGPAPLAEPDATSASSQWFQACTQRNTAPVPYGTALNLTLCPGPTSALEDVDARPCCSTAIPRIHGLLTNVGEWIDACTGNAGAADTCRVMGNVRPTVACATNAQSLGRGNSSNQVGFRCCAP